MKEPLLKQVFGRLTVVGVDLGRKAPPQSPGRYYLRVRCTCGTKKSVRRDMLLNGNTVSCGCKKKEHGLKHGYGRRGTARSKTYIAWDAMIQRCTNTSHPSYKDYGARGIKVCRPWLTFENFLADIGEAPEGLELERDHNDQNYKPSNCSWQTRKHQTRNTRRTIKVVYQGERVSLRDLAEKLDLPFARIYYRLRAGWALNDAVTKAPHDRSKRF